MVNGELRLIPSKTPSEQFAKMCYICDYVSETKLHSKVYENQSIYGFWAKA